MGNIDSSPVTMPDLMVTHITNMTHKLVLNIATSDDVFYRVTIRTQHKHIRSTSKLNRREDFVIAARGRWFRIKLEGARADPFPTVDMTAISEEEKRDGFNFRTTQIDLPPLVYAAVLGVLMTNTRSEHQWRPSDEEDVDEMEHAQRRGPRVLSGQMDDQDDDDVTFAG
jgi:hypothetical protein